MKKTTMMALLLIVGFMLSACGMKQVKYDSSKNIHIKKIAIATMPNPQKIGVPGANAGAIFGLAGVVIDSVDNASRDREANEFREKTKFSFQAELTKSLQQNLQQKNFSVEMVDIPRKGTLYLAKDPKTIQSNAHAVLEGSLNPVKFGYHRKGLIDKLKPSMTITFRLTDISSGEVLYKEVIEYGIDNPFMEGTFIEAPEQYQFMEDEDSENILAEKGPLIIEGLRDAVQRVAKKVADNLTGGGDIAATKIEENSNNE